MRIFPSKTISLSAGFRELLTRPHGQVPVLDALRAIAVILVICDHTFVWWRELTGRDLMIGKLPIFYFGWTGVDLFFILSGYLIGRQIWRESIETGTVQVRRFILRRGLRIWPLYFFIAVFATFYRGSSFKFSDLFFYSNYVNGSVAGGWSLSTEEQFYLIFPLVVVAAAYFAISTKTWVVILVTAIGAVQIARWNLATSLLSSGLPIKEVKEGLLYSAGHLRCESLLVGVMLALAQSLWPTSIAPVRTNFGKFLAGGLLLFGPIAAVGLRSLDPLVLWTLSLAIFYGSLTLSLLLLRNTKLVENRIVSSVVFYQISRLSFGMYLWQLYIVKTFFAYFGVTIAIWFGSGNVGFLTALLLGTVCTAVVSALTFVGIEQPFLQFRDHLFRSERTRRIVIPQQSAKAGI